MPGEPSNHLLKFYGEHGVIPVRQDLSDWTAHVARRRNLYALLGLPPVAFQGARVLEIGPGTGDNAAALPALGCTDLTLLDGNPASIASLEAKRAAGAFDGVALEVLERDFTQAAFDAPFDIVLCEGVVPGHRDADAAMRRLASFTRPGGVIVTTTVSAVSLLSEIARRALMPALVPPGAPPREAAEIMADAFADDIASLPGRSRIPVDWAMDTLVHPWDATSLYDMAEAAEAMRGVAEPLGASPSFMTDWRWYKAIHLDAERPTDRFRRLYAAAAHGLLDYRSDPTSAPGDAALPGLARAFYDLHLTHRAPGGANWVGLAELMARIAAATPAEAAATRASMAAIETTFRTLEAGGAVAVDSAFRGWFGRGQQYLSFLRTDAPA